LWASHGADEDGAFAYNVVVLAAALALLTTPPDVDPIALHRLLRRCAESQTWGLVVWRDGKPIVERDNGPQPTCNLMSATKSITSLAVGLLIDQGRIPSVDTPVQKFFPKYVGKWKERVTVRHLLDHTSGIRTYADDPNAKDFPLNRVASALGAPVVTEPGTVFAYNNRAVDLLSGVVRRAAGMPLDEFVDKRIFKPLGISAYYWMRDPDGNPHGCAELFITPRDMAKIGQLMLDRGVWRGKRLLSEKYVVDATTMSKISDKEGTPCGWLWWICDPWFTIDDESMRSFEKAGLSDGQLQRLRPLIGGRWPSPRELGFDVMHVMGGADAEKNGLDKLGDLTDHVSNAPDYYDVTGYAALGWGGQMILVIPEDRIVAVRTCGSGFFDTKDVSKYEMGDFYRLVRALVRPK